MPRFEEIQDLTADLFHHVTLHSDSVWEGTKEPLGLWDDEEVREEHQNLHRTPKNNSRGAKSLLELCLDLVNERQRYF